MLNRGGIERERLIVASFILTIMGCVVPPRKMKAGSFLIVRYAP